MRDRAILDRRAVVVGAGVAGTTAAVALCRAGYQVELVESSPRSGARRFRGELVHPPGLAALQHLGLRAQLDFGQECGGFVVREPARNREAVLHYSAVPGGSTSGRICRFDLLAGTLLHAAIAAGATLRHDAHVVDLVVRERRASGVVLADGTALAGDIVVLAAGRRATFPSIADTIRVRPIRSWTVPLEVNVDFDSAGLTSRMASVVVGGPGPMLLYPLGPGVARLTLDIPAQLYHLANLANVFDEFYAPYLPPPISAAAAISLRHHLAPIANLEVARIPARIDGVFRVGDHTGVSHPVTASGLTRAAAGAVAIATAAQGPRRETHRTNTRLVQQQRLATMLAGELHMILSQSTADALMMRDGLYRYWQSRRRRRSSVRALTGQASQRQVILSYVAVALLGCRAPHVTGAPTSSLARCMIAGRLLRRAAPLVTSRTPWRPGAVA